MMDGLDEFEKTLAAEKLAREKSEEQSSKNKHKSKSREHRKHRHHRPRDDHDHDNHDSHRHKRSKHDGEDHQRHRRSRSPDEKHVANQNEPTKPQLQRDSWMTGPSALDIDYTQRGKRVEVATKISKPDYDLKIHKNELNHHLQDLADGKDLDSITNLPAKQEVDYTFGDAGSQWRMTRLKVVRTQAESSGQSLEEVAVQRFGGLREYDNAREEEIEMDRRKVYGDGYVGKQIPTGELYDARRLDQGENSARVEESIPASPETRDLPVAAARPAAVDHTTLNRLKAQLIKAKLKRSGDVERLEAEYEAAAASFANSDPSIVVLGTMDNRMLAGTRGEVKAIDNKRGRERGLVEDNEDMTIEDMIREERRTRNQAGGDGLRLAERIAKDGKFTSDLDYMEDNAEKLAKRVQKSEHNLKNAAIGEYQKMARILHNCQLCHQEDQDLPPVAPIVSLGTRVYLTLPTEPEISDGGAVLVPIQHRTNLLECDDDEWEELRNFMKSLTRMYHDQGRDVVFYENAAAPQRKMHAAMHVVPLLYGVGATAPAFFREAILASDAEWTQHRKLIDTGARAREGLGKQAFRRSLAKEMPYFHAWFSLDGGLGHVVEDANLWPRGDLFAREIIGGMLDVEMEVIKRQGRWRRDDARVEGFRKRWRPFDWTRVLTDG